MQHYKLDEYVQEHPADDAVHLNCVANWCVCADAAGPVESLLVKFQNRPVRSDRYPIKWVNLNCA
jgi:hypothetical protein